jgi:copper resistance protein B
MRSDRWNRWTSGALRVGLLLGGLTVALARPAGAQGIGLKQLKEMMAWGTGSLVLFDKLEYAPEAEGRPLSLDLIGWYGGAYNRLWFRAEGEQLTALSAGEGEAQLSYGRLVTPYWDALAGVRVDRRWGDESGTRAHLAVGVVGLAPMRFEVSPTLFLSQDGDLSGRLEAEYQVLITQRLVVEPELEVNAALQEVPEWGVGKGLNDMGLGLRLRYEIRREFAPYVGYAWTRRFGGTADLAGGAVSEGALVAGFRTWF